MAGALNHRRHEGAWIKIAKTCCGVASITSAAAVDIGLCWGWISSHRKALDGTYFLQKYTRADRIAAGARSTSPRSRR